MNTLAISRHALPAVIRRERRTALRNRFVQVFALVTVGGSLLLSAFSPGGAALQVALLLLILYVVPLFALLAGVSAAHEELEEQAFLMSQPVGRFTYAAGKLLTRAALLVGTLAVALASAALLAGSAGALAALWALGAALVLVGVSVGLALGEYVRSRPEGLMLSLLVWFATLVLYDLLALSLSHVAFFQGAPTFWTAVLLVNPIDAVRLTGLLALGDVPFSVPGESAGVRLLLDALPAWTAAVTLVWTGAAVWAAHRAVDRRDV